MSLITKTLMLLDTLMKHCDVMIRHKAVEPAAFQAICRLFARILERAELEQVQARD